MVARSSLIQADLSALPEGAGAFVPGALDTEYDAACFMTTEGGGDARAPYMMVTWRLVAPPG